MKLSSMIEQSLTPRDAVTSRLKENVGAIFQWRWFSKRESDLKKWHRGCRCRGSGTLCKTDVLSEKELLARVTVLIGSLCQHLDHQSVGDGTDDGGSRHSCVCHKSEFVRGTDFASEDPVLCVMARGSLVNNPHMLKLFEKCDKFIRRRGISLTRPEMRMPTTSALIMMVVLLGHVHVVLLATQPRLKISVRQF